MHSKRYLGIGKDFSKNRQNKTYNESEQEDKERKESKATVPEDI